MKRVWWGLYVMVLMSISPCAAAPLLQESFETSVLSNRDIFAEVSPTVRSESGVLVLVYRSDQPSAPAGLELSLPISPVDPVERDYDLRFLGGGSDLSNSLFVSYALGPGRGFSLPPLPSQPSLNDRSGYILRWIRHGDGTPELAIYRNDGGWVRHLLSERSLPANPIRTLRRVEIQHRENGDHVITSTFDAARGQPARKSVHFFDTSYPPGNARRIWQVAAKGHAAVATDNVLIMDTWAVTDQTHSVPVFGPPRPPERVSTPAPTAGAGSKSIEDRLSMARGLMSHGDPVSARSIAQEALALAPGHADAMELLARIESELGNLSESIRLHRRVLSIRRRRFGVEHPSVADSLEHMARLYSSKDPADAEKLFRMAVDIRQKAFGPDHPAIASALRGLGRLYQNQGRDSAAERFFTQSLGIYERTGSPDSSAERAALDELGALYLKQSRHADSWRVYRSLLAKQEAIGETSSHGVSLTLRTLSLLSQTLGRQSESREYLERALGITETQLGPDHLEVAKVLSNLAVLYQNSGLYDHAETLYLRAVDIRSSRLGPSHPLLAQTVYYLATLYRQLGRLPESERQFQTALSILEPALGQDHEQVGVILEKLAAVHRQMGRPDDADSAARRAEKIRGRGVRRPGPPSAPDTALKSHKPE